MMKPHWKNFLPLVLALTFIGALAFALSAFKKQGYFFVYEVTPSVPKGIYLIVPSEKFKRHDLVLFRPPPAVASFLEEKHWLPDSGLMMKYVFGVPGDWACTYEDALWLNGMKLAPIFDYYAPGAKLPRTTFCESVASRQYLLLSTIAARSFDGRYFGTIGADNILGKAVLVWQR